MKIAIFTNNYLPNPYGVPSSIETFRHDFERSGHQVFIFAPNWPGYHDSNPNVFRYPSIDIEAKIRFPIPIPYSWKISRKLRELGIDIIHAQHPNLLGSAARRWARKKKVPLVFTWHTLYEHYADFVPLIPKRLSVWYMIRKAVSFANKADIVIVPTGSIISSLRKRGVKSEIVAQCTGVMEEDFQEADRDLIRDKYGFRKDDIVLLVVTRLTKEKNVEFLFHSVSKVLKRNENVKFLIVGGGYLAQKLKKYANTDKIDDQVFFASHVPEEEKKHYFAAGDIFVFASKSETQGMVYSEAMYMGLPIVALDATGARSMVLNNGNGLLVKEDEKEFEEAIVKLIEDEDLRARFGETSARIAKQKYTSSICAAGMLEIYEKAIRDYRKK